MAIQSSGDFHTELTSICRTLRPRLLARIERYSKNLLRILSHHGSARHIHYKHIENLRDRNGGDFWSQYTRTIKIPPTGTRTNNCRGIISLPIHQTSNQTHIRTSRHVTDIRPALNLYSLFRLNIRNSTLQRTRKINMEQRPIQSRHHRPP